MSNRLINNKKLINEWNHSKNIGLDIEKITTGSHIRVWWVCPKGHEYEASVSNRTRGTGCPYCSGHKLIKGENDFATLYPELVKEWNYEKNDIVPDELSPSSKKKRWWICSNGHEYEASVGSRTRGTGCPYCSGRVAIRGYNDFRTAHPELMEEWDFKKNKNINPEELLPAVNLKVWWKCSKGHEWEASLNNRHRGTGCPICSSETQSSYPEQIILYYLNKIFKLENRYIFKNKEIDIFIPGLDVGIEYDGIYYHNSAEALAKEKIKDKILRENGIFLIRIKESKSDDYYDENNQIIYYKPKHDYKNLKDVLEILINIINKKFKLNEKIDFDLNRDSNDILLYYKTLKKENSVAYKNKKLFNEWNFEKNKGLNPEFFDVSSRYKVWWKCSKGHEWEATIDSRNRGTDCPYCSGSLAIVGENDFATLYPEIVKEWHLTKNENLNPNTFLPNSEKKVWWKCTNGHEYEASVGNRTRGTGCPYCSGKKVLKGFNDLKTWSIVNNYKYLIDEFDYKKNDFDIEEITYGSGKKVWWICPKGHSYQTFLTHRTKMFTNCPYCSNKKLLSGYNDLGTTHPNIAQEWDYKKNNPVKPCDVMAGSNNKKYWFICCKGHSYDSTLLNRKKGRNCPVCYKSSRSSKKD